MSSSRELGLTSLFRDLKINSCINNLRILTFLKNNTMYHISFLFALKDCKNAFFFFFEAIYSSYIVCSYKKRIIDIHFKLHQKYISFLLIPKGRKNLLHVHVLHRFGLSFYILVYTVVQKLKLCRGSRGFQEAKKCRVFFFTYLENMWNGEDSAKRQNSMFTFYHGVNFWNISLWWFWFGIIFMDLYTG